jgi:hypothetical protein
MSTEAIYHRRHVGTVAAVDDGLFPPERGRLHIDGTTFRTEDNALWPWRGVSWFLGFLRFCRGEDVTPDLRWLRAMGFNIVRVFGPLPWVETPDYRVESFQFDKLPAFFALLEAHGLRCNWSLAHYKDPNLKPYVQRWYDIAADFWCPVAEVVNEPTVGAKPDPIDLLKGINRRGVLTSYGLYSQYYDKNPGLDPVLDFGTIHITRDDAWDRKARHAQEWQAACGKPIISDEPAKITEPGFHYPGGKNDPLHTPQEAVWHFGIAAMYGAGGTFHCEEGKWGTCPTPGMLQHTVAEAVRDHVFLKIGPQWQTGQYSGSHMSSSPVHFEQDVWAYSAILGNTAVSVRVKAEPSQAVHGWRVKDRWGPGDSLAVLERP